MTIVRLVYIKGIR